MLPSLFVTMTASGEEMNRSWKTAGLPNGTDAALPIGASRRTGGWGASPAAISPSHSRSATATSPQVQGAVSHPASTFRSRPPHREHPSLGAPLQQLSPGPSPSAPQQPSGPVRGAPRESVSAVASVCSGRSASLPYLDNMDVIRKVKKQNSSAFTTSCADGRAGIIISLVETPVVAHQAGFSSNDGGSSGRAARHPGSSGLTRYFQASLLCTLATAFFVLASTGRLDT